MRTRRLSRFAAAAASVALLSAALVACTDEGDNGGEDAPSTTTVAPAEETTPVTPTDTTTTVTTTPDDDADGDDADADAEATSSRQSRNANNSDMPEDVRAVAEMFSTLAPMSLFESFESCSSIGRDTYGCTGAETGQIQFFDSPAKAATQTEVITGLRSARVVKDTGDHVVGWSVTGGTAVISAIDNERGHVLQFMVSPEQVEPDDVIRELGLINPDQEGADEAEPSTTRGNDSDADSDSRGSRSSRTDDDDTDQASRRSDSELFSHA